MQLAQYASGQQKFNFREWLLTCEKRENADING